MIKSWNRLQKSEFIKTNQPRMDRSSAVGTRNESCSISGELDGAVGTKSDSRKIEGLRRNHVRFTAVTLTRSRWAQFHHFEPCTKIWTRNKCRYFPCEWNYSSNVNSNLSITLVEVDFSSRCYRFRLCDSCAKKTSWIKIKKIGTK
jgi:hypothetical protein